MKQVPYRLAEALKNICKRKPLEAITVSEITAEAKLTRQVFYHYFGDKFALASWIHCVHLCKSVKNALETKSQSIWHQTTLNWLECLVENKTFYMNAFQSVSQKEFQRNIRDSFFACYQWQMEVHLHRSLQEDELFVLHTYCIGSMEKVYEWINHGMVTPPEKMVHLLELAMPELMHNVIETFEEIPYAEAIKMVEQQLSAEGLSQADS